MLSLPQYTVLGVMEETDATVLYHGRRNADDVPVAIKVLRGEHPNPGDLARLKHEYAVLKELEVPGVVRAYALERSQRGPAVVLEHLGGRSLRELLAGGPLELPVVLGIGSSLAGTLSAIHERRVIHKDIRPGSVIVDRAEGRVTITEFGIATRLFQETRQPESPAHFEGTLAYMSPEQTGRMNRVVDARSDLYSLGATLYEALTGRPPFLDADPMDLVHSHIAKAPPRPGELAPAIPEVVSDIVMKLLAKAAEERYQSAAGLKVDLDTCLAALDQRGAIEPFALAERDTTVELRLPQKLYGREAELAALGAAFERASVGAAELLIIKGPAGVGKSALVHEIHKAIARRGGAFGSGKFDQLSQGMPYAPVANALREIFRHILTESAASLSRWKERLTGVLGNDGQLVVDLVPELSLCIGAQPPLVTLPPNEAKSRFRLVFQGFIRAVAAERTLVLFIDDLQWADPASLTLVHLLLTDPDSARLLLIGAYRDNEIDETHPTARALSELRRAGAVVTEIALTPLSPDDVTALLGDAFAAADTRIPPLAALAFEKTSGNPFFLGRFLHALHRDGLLRFDVASGRWTWEIGEIASTTVSDNVVEFLLGKIRQLSAETQRMLSLAACIGHTFSQRTLATVAEANPSHAAADLWPALVEGLLIPLDAGYRFFDTPDKLEREASAFDIRYRFSHDRVQQAAYSLIEEGLRREVHLRIGRLLAADALGNPQGEALLAVVRHKNLGAPLITDRAERLDLARHNLLAGKQAKAKAAYAASADYFRTGTALVDDDAWEADRSLAFELHVERSESEVINGRFDDAEALYGDLRRRVTTDVERAFVESARITLYITSDRADRALAVGLLAARSFGIDLPEDDADVRAAMSVELEAIGDNLRGRPIEALLDAPEIADPAKLAVLKLLTALWLPTTLVRPTLRDLVVLKQVNFSLRHGNSDVAAFGYMSYASLLARVLVRCNEARPFARLAMALNERYNNTSLVASLHFNFGACAHLFEPIHVAVLHNERAHHIGFTTGDPARAAYAGALMLGVKRQLSIPLDELEAEIDRFLTKLRKHTWNELGILIVLFVRQMARSLMGRTKGRKSLGDDEFDEAQGVASTARPGFDYAGCWYYALMVELAYLDDDYAAAIENVPASEARSGPARSSHFLTDLALFGFLSHAALLPSAAPDEAKRHAHELDRHQAKMAIWADSAPTTYRHRHLLMLAERARLEGRAGAARELYDQAIDGARANDFLRDEAVANEAAGRYHLGAGRARLARIYLTDAHYAYRRWGARAKMAALEERYPEFFVDVGAEEGGAAARAKRDQRPVDVMAVVRAAQAIAGEIELDQVIERLLQITLSTAHAERGVLILSRDERLSVEAIITLEPDEVRQGLALPLEQAGADLAVSVMRYVEQTREIVMLGEATREAKFAVDPYVARARPRSILCLPMVYHGRLTGALYLENNTVAFAFTPARTEVCRLLASQAAIAVENAMLYGRVHMVTEELARTNEDLERDVERRTEQLRIELLQRRQAELARAELKEEIIRVQHERLSELSTPLIPILDRIVALPLIGAVDAERAQQVLETVLRGASEHRAKIVIVDITGVKQADAVVASTLVRTAHALELLGAQAVITGISPHVAEMLAEMGLSLGGMVTRSTLQGGIAYAVGRTRAKASRRSARRAREVGA